MVYIPFNKRSDPYGHYKRKSAREKTDSHRLCSALSGKPMIPEGVKTDKSDSIVTQNYVTEHVEIGIASLRMIIDEKKTVKHLKFDW